MWTWVEKDVDTEEGYWERYLLVPWKSWYPGRQRHGDRLVGTLRDALVGAGALGYALVGALGYC